MKKSIALILALIAAAFAACLTGCVSISESYPNADKYSSGNAKFKGVDVRALDVNWNSGKVTVSKSDTDEVTVSETSKNDLKDSQKVHTWLDGDVLRIRFCKSGEAFVGFGSLEKELEVTIPKDMELGAVDFSGSSGDVLFDNITAASFDVETSSGDIKLLGCSAKKFDVEVSSGEVTVEQKGEADSIEAEASSGSIEITAEKVGELSVETSSGNSVVRLSSLPAVTDITASSGNVKLYAPKDAEFTAKIEASSGDFDSNFELKKDGDTYIKGDGSSKINIETSSGDIKLLTLSD